MGITDICILILIYSYFHQIKITNIEAERGIMAGELKKKTWKKESV